MRELAWISEEEEMNPWSWTHHHSRAMDAEQSIVEIRVSSVNVIQLRRLPPLGLAPTAAERPSKTEDFALKYQHPHLPYHPSPFLPIPIR